MIRSGLSAARSDKLHIGDSNNVIELMSNQSINMTNLTSLTTSQGANLTSLVVMVPRVCPTALRKSHWYTRYEFLHIPFSLCFTLSNS